MPTCPRKPAGNSNGRSSSFDAKVPISPRHLVIEIDAREGFCRQCGRAVSETVLLFQAVDTQKKAREAETSRAFVCETLNGRQVPLRSPKT